MDATGATSPGLVLQTAEEIGGAWQDATPIISGIDNYVLTLTRDVPEGEQGHLGNYLRWHIYPSVAPERASTMLISAV